MSEPEESTTSSIETNTGNLSAVQSISAKLLEVTRLAEKLDAKLCEAGARSQALNPATEDDELPRSPMSDDAVDSGVGTSAAKEGDETGVRDESGGKLEEPTTKETDQRHQDSRASNRSIVEDSSATMDEYVTATECSSVPRSRSESFLSCEYEDGPVSTTCIRSADDEPTMKNETLAVAKTDAAVSTSPIGDQHVIEYSPDGATVISRTIQEKGGKIIKETTETTTLRVSHDTRMGVASYKLVSNTIADHTEHTDVHEMQDLHRTILPDGTPASKTLQTHREEHTYASPNGLISYHKSAANGHSDVDDELARIEENKLEEDELLAMMRTVSEESSGGSTPLQLVRVPDACGDVVEEIVAMPAPVPICEFN